MVYLKSMVRFYKISLLFTVAVLCFGLSKTAQSADLYHDGEIALVKTQQQSTIIPASTPELIGVHRQGRSALNLLRILPAPNAKNNDNDIPKLGLLAEIPIHRAVSIYLCFSRDINQSLTIRELLFPFHHFL